MKNSAAGLLTSLDDLFSTQEEREIAAQPRVEDIPIDQIDDFPDHPFKVRMDGAMVRLVESVGQYGVLEPCLIRPKPDGRYEMVAGHRRKEACIMADCPSIRCIVQEMTDDQAVIIMVDSNLHREEILPSEKAFAYKMKLDAMKRQGVRTDLTCAPPGHKSVNPKSRDILAEESGDSKSQIQRYIRLTYLIPEILEMVDNSVLKEKDKLQIALRPAVELSYLTEQEQHDLNETMMTEDRTPSHAQAIKMRKFSQDGRLNVTEGTFDSYLWQTVENKQKFISQIMTSKSPVRFCEDVDETALSYAEIKALCAGDPRIKEKMDLDIEVARLKLLKADHQSQQFRLEDNLLKFFPEQVEKFKGIIAGIEKDMVILADHPHPTDGFSGMTVKGDTLTDKDNAGAALLEACKEATGYDPVSIGTYRGFSMTVTLENFGKDYYLQLKGNLSYSVKLGSDARGNLVRIENELAQLPLRLNGTKAQLQNTYTQMENARAEIGKPFPQEAELRQKSDRLAELNILLDMDGKSKSQQIADGAIVAKSDRPSVLDKLKTPAIHGCQGKTHNLNKEER